MVSFRKTLIHAALSLTLIAPALALAQDKAAESPKPAAVETALDGVVLQGTILETMNSNGYTYLLLDAAQGKIWVAIPETQVKSGQTVTASPGMTMFNFTSKTINRTFDRIVFSPGLDKSGSGPAQPAAEAKPGKEVSGFHAALQAESAAGRSAMPGAGGESAAMETSSGSVGAIVPSAQVNVNKATGPNSFSVGECFEQGKELNGKTVRVRGKVMKISLQIMGKNWLHIQDGTGNPLKNQHDLVVTTTAEATEGAVITIEGTLAAGRDFGAGYSYEVIIEDAAIIEQ